MCWSWEVAGTSSFPVFEYLVGLKACFLVYVPVQYLGALLWFQKWLHLVELRAAAKRDHPTFALSHSPFRKLIFRDDAPGQKGRKGERISPFRGSPIHDHLKPTMKTSDWTWNCSISRISVHLKLVNRTCLAVSSYLTAVDWFCNPWKSFWSLGNDLHALEEAL